MPTAPPPPKKPPAPPKGNPPPGNSAVVPSKDFTVQTGKTLEFHKVGVYGPGGSGKSTLAALIEKQGIKPLFIDVDNETGHLNVARVEVDNWNDLRAVCHDKKLLQPFGALVIDSLTKAEEFARIWVLENIKKEKVGLVKNIEDFGWGKGFTHIYETFLLLLGDLDAVYRDGKHIIVTAHDCTDIVPNPLGEDWLQWAPRLQHPPKGKASIRLRVKEWCTHLLYIGYDVSVSKGDGDKAGKAVGSGTRTIYPRELPSHLAKSRTLEDPIPYEQGSALLWEQLLNTGE